MSAIARRLDATEGQVWSLGVGLAVAVVLAVTGIPPVVHHSHAPAPPLFAAQSAATPATGAPEAPAPTVTTPVTAAPAIATPNTTAASTVVGPPSTGTPLATAPPVEGNMTVPAAAAVPFGTVRALVSVQAPLGGIVVIGPRVVVGTDDGTASHVLAYDDAGRQVSDLAVSGQPTHHGRGITAIAAEPGGDIVAADAAGARVLRIDLTAGRQTTAGTILDLPSCVLAPSAPHCEPGLEDHQPLLRGVAVAPDGTIYVADAGQATVWRIRPGGQAEPWWQSLLAASGDGPTAIAVAPDGGVLLSVGTDLNPSNPAAASIYRIPVGTGGAAGTAVLVAKLAKGDQPTGLVEAPGALGAPGATIAVALHAVDTIVMLAAGGTEVARIRGAVIAGPVGLAVAGDGELVASTHPATGPSRILRVGVGRRS